MHRLRLHIVLCALLVLPLSARSQESTPDPGRFKGLEVTRITVTGIDDDMASQLRNGLALAQSSGLLRTRHPLLYARTLGQDLSRCRLFLARRGYPYSRVAAELEARGDDGVEVRIVINPGPVVKVASVTVTGVPEDAQRWHVR